MKRILTLFAMLFSVSIFACDGVVHETLEEVKTLYKQGYEGEARELLNELALVNSYDFTVEEICSFNRVSYYFNYGQSKWYCTKCQKPAKNNTPDICSYCHNTSFILK